MSTKSKSKSKSNSKVQVKVRAQANEFTENDLEISVAENVSALHKRAHEVSVAYSLKFGFPSNNHNVALYKVQTDGSVKFVLIPCPSDTRLMEKAFDHQPVEPRHTSTCYFVKVEGRANLLKLAEVANFHMLLASGHHETYVTATGVSMYQGRILPRTFLPFFRAKSDNLKSSFNPYRRVEDATAKEAESVFAWVRRTAKLAGEQFLVERGWSFPENFKMTELPVDGSDITDEVVNGISLRAFRVLESDAMGRAARQVIHAASAQKISGNTFRAKMHVGKKFVEVFFTIGADETSLQVTVS